MSSPIFDSTFGTGRFRYEEPMTTDQSQSDTKPKQDVREALELQLFDLVELARDSRSDKGGEAKWVHPRGALVKEFAKRIAALAKSDAGHEPGNDFPDCIEKTLTDLYTAPPRPDASGLVRALERISKSDVYDMDTLHPDRCASVAAEALKAFRAADRSAK